MKRIIALALVLVVSVGLFVGCGSKKSSDAKKWVIGMDTVFKPFEYTDAKGNFVGIDVDILKAVAKDQGFEYEIKSLGWDAAIAACQANQADALIAGASITAERKKTGWIFSDGYFTATQCMAVKAGSDIDDFDDLDGKTVAVKNGTEGASYAAKLAKKYKFKITKVKDSDTMYQSVSGGQADACFEDTPIMKASIKDGIKLQVVNGTENEGSDYGAAVFNKNKKEFIDTFNKGLANIKKDGTYDKIIEKYLGK